MPKTKRPHGVEVFHVGSKESKQQKLRGLEIWIAKKKAQLDLRCGGPFEVVEGVGPFSVMCPGDKKKRWVTIILPGDKKTLNVAELKVWEGPIASDE